MLESYNNIKYIPHFMIIPYLDKTKKIETNIQKRVIHKINSPEFLHVCVVLLPPAVEQIFDINHLLLSDVSFLIVSARLCPEKRKFILKVAITETTTAVFVAKYIYVYFLTVQEKLTFSSLEEK